MDLKNRADSHWNASCSARRFGGAFVVAVLVVWLCSGSSQDVEPRAEAEAIAFLRASQLGVVLDDPRGEVRFRASAVGRRDTGSLFLLTAAHCISEKDQGRTLILSQETGTCRAKVKRVVTNPGHQPGVVTSIPGADNAIAEVEMQLETEKQREWFKTIELAELTIDPIPAPKGDVVAACSIDQKSTLHRMRAGNFSNPRWLEWGDRYKPIPGDSGSGVFAIVETSNGKSKPILIGVVTDRSALGGGASVIFLRLRWLAEALLDPPKDRKPGSR